LRWLTRSLHIRPMHVSSIRKVEASIGDYALAERRKQKTAAGLKWQFLASKASRSPIKSEKSCTYSGYESQYCRLHHAFLTR
jgi:hypothetical protein